MSEKPQSNTGSLQKADLLQQRALVQTDEHSLEYVAHVNGVGYINDSKSIRLTETLHSLERMVGAVVLITGGEDKGNDYSILSKQVKKVSAIIYLGEDGDSILQHFSTHSMLFAKASSIEESVKMAYYFASSDDIVLFSPGCDHSFDYKVRGYRFKKEVKNLPGATSR